MLFVLIATVSDTSMVPLFQLDREDFSSRLLQAVFVPGPQFVVGGNHCPQVKYPLLRLCRRPRDGDRLLTSVVELQSVHHEYKNRMLVEAVRRGSADTVNVSARFIDLVM